MGLTLGPKLKMTKKTRLLLAINNFVYEIYLFINTWAFNHMDKDISPNCNKKSEHGKQ